MVRVGLDVVEQLVERAGALCLRAPELALVLGERAAALAEAAGSDELWIRAESLVVSARVRIGDRPATVGRAVAALRAAEDAGYRTLAARLRIDLTVCARSVDAPLTGLAALRPVLTDRELPGGSRAEALCHLVGCLAQFGRKSELDRVLTEADRLCSADESLAADTRLLLRALLRVGTSAHRRRHGDLTAAADAARTGLGFLDRLDKPEDDGGVVRLRLILQLVCTLLDRGDPEMALEITQPLLASPIRAAGVGPAGWLRLAIATRVHLPAGSAEAARMMLCEAVHSTDRHGLHALTAKLWLELAQLEERLGRPNDAIECLHRSRAAEHVYGRIRRQALGLLSGEFGAGAQALIDLDDVLSVDQTKATSKLGQSVVAGTPAVPEFRLAPVPAETVAETPHPRQASVFPGSETSRPSGSALWASESSSQRRDDADSSWESRQHELPVMNTTRHDSEHGSLAARSVLDRLGAFEGGGGGRRRAGGEATEAASVPSARTENPTIEMPALVEPRLPVPPVPGDTRGPDEPPVDKSRLTDDEYREQVADPWLPRLRMPPSLEPTADQDFGWSSSETSGSGAAADLGAPFADGFARAIAEDEPPPGAGLAELLTRALAEHRAGTASAAALVKRLGPKRDEPSGYRPANGHRPHQEETFDNGHPRTGE